MRHMIVHDGRLEPDAQARSGTSRFQSLDFMPDSSNPLRTSGSEFGYTSVQNHCIPSVRAVPDLGGASGSIHGPRCRFHDQVTVIYGTVNVLVPGSKQVLSLHDWNLSLSSNGPVSPGAL